MSHRLPADSLDRPGQVVDQRYTIESDRGHDRVPTHPELVSHTRHWASHLRDQARRLEPRPEGHHMTRRQTQMRLCPCPQSEAGHRHRRFNTQSRTGRPKRARSLISTGRRSCASARTPTAPTSVNPRDRLDGDSQTRLAFRTRPESGTRPVPTPSPPVRYFAHR